MKKSLRSIIAVLMVQAYSMAYIFSPVAAYSANQSRLVSNPGSQKNSLPFATKVYTAKAGDNLNSLVKAYNISRRALLYINGSSILLGDKNTIRKGAIILLPKAPLSASVSKRFDADLSSDKFKDYMNYGARLAANGSISDDLKSDAVSYASNEVTQWFNQFGTLQLSMGVHSFHIGADALLPILDRKNKLIFAQASYHYIDGRKQANLGLGGRYFYPDYTVGLNGFLDYDMTGKNYRFGAGLEYWRNYLKLAANGYLGLTNWHHTGQEMYDQRPASGFDVKGSYYLPFMPEIGLNVAYEKYFGDVALFGGKDSINSPQALSLGVDYSPVPLLTVSLDHKRVPKGKSLTSLSVQAVYRIGVPFVEQLKRENVGAIRQLSGNRYDLVARNNNIFLAYKKFSGISIYPEISGYGGQSFPLVERSSLGEEWKISWEGNEDFLAANGGRLTDDCYAISKFSACQVVLPKYDEKNPEKNVYHIKVTLTNTKTNEKIEKETRIKVLSKTKPSIKPEGELVVAKPYIAAHQKTDVDLYLKDSKKRVIDIQGNFQLKILPKTKDGLDVDLPKSLTYVDKGHYRGTITAGNKTGLLYIAARLEGSEENISVAQVHIVDGKDNLQKASFSVSDTNVDLSKKHSVELRVSLENAQGFPIIDKSSDITFHVECEKGNGTHTLSPIQFTESGYYVSNLEVSGAGLYKVYASLKGDDSLSDQKEVIHFFNGDIINRGHIFTVDKDVLYYNKKEANQNDQITLSYRVTDQLSRAAKVGSMDFGSEINFYLFKKGKNDVFMTVLGLQTGSDNSYVKVLKARNPEGYLPEGDYIASISPIYTEALKEGIGVKFKVIDNRSPEEKIAAITDFKRTVFLSNPKEDGYNFTIGLEEDGTGILSTDEKDWSFPSLDGVQINFVKKLPDNRLRYHLEVLKEGEYSLCAHYKKGDVDRKTRTISFKVLDVLPTMNSHLENEHEAIAFDSQSGRNDLTNVKLTLFNQSKKEVNFSILDDKDLAQALENKLKLRVKVKDDGAFEDVIIDKDGKDFTLTHKADNVYTFAMKGKILQDLINLEKSKRFAVIPITIQGMFDSHPITKPCALKITKDVIVPKKNHLNVEHHVLNVRAKKKTEPIEIDFSSDGKPMDPPHDLKFVVYDPHNPIPGSDKTWIKNVKYIRTESKSAVTFDFAPVYGGEFKIKAFYPAPNQNNEIEDRELPLSGDITFSVKDELNADVLILKNIQSVGKAFDATKPETSFQVSFDAEDQEGHPIANNTFTIFMLLPNQAPFTKVMTDVKGNHYSGSVSLSELLKKYNQIPKEYVMHISFKGANVPGIEYTIPVLNAPNQ